MPRNVVDRVDRYMALVEEHELAEEAELAAAQRVNDAWKAMTPDEQAVANQWLLEKREGLE